jgi:hypothetical protein
MRNRIAKDIIGSSEYYDDSDGIHLGATSIVLFLVLSISAVSIFKSDYLHWSYLRGLNNDLSFFIGFFSIIFGIGFYHYWRLGEKSAYYLNIARAFSIPDDTIILFSYKGYTFGVGHQSNVETVEFPAIVRKIICMIILFNIALVTFDNSGFEKLRTMPSEFTPSKSEYCPENDETLDSAAIPQGCELIIRAYKLGYAKDLGICEPKKIDPEKMQVCSKRRADEPYLHYMSRLLLRSVEEQKALFDSDNLKKIEDKFDLQVNSIETLKDYQVYAISAEPRASHHIWTDLPYPQHVIIQKYQEYLDPNYCLDHFQNQTNTIALQKDDERKNSKLLEHVYGQLLFNPKSKLTVGYCKEYKIHWNSEPEICERLASNPERVLQEESVLPEVELVLHRHDVANALLTLEESIRDIERDKGKDKGDSRQTKVNLPDYIEGVESQKMYAKRKGKIDVKSKIAKSKQQIRKKNEIVSFQCLMRATGSSQKSKVSRFTFDDTDFAVTTRYFPVLENNSESQLSMYNELSKLLDDRFHYSQLTSRSDVKIEGVTNEVPDVEKFLEEPAYLFTRLDILKNVDIFLGNNWVLERDDLLKVYPYHVHLQNYVDIFREKYEERHGRL